MHGFQVPGSNSISHRAFRHALEDCSRDRLGRSRAEGGGCFGREASQAAKSFPFSLESSPTMNGARMLTVMVVPCRMVLRRMKKSHFGSHWNDEVITEWGLLFSCCTLLCFCVVYSFISCCHFPVSNQYSDTTRQRLGTLVPSVAESEC